MIPMPEATPTKPGPGQTVTESEFLPDPQAAVKGVKPTATTDPTQGADQ